MNESEQRPYRQIKDNKKERKEVPMARKHAKNKQQTFSITAPHARTVTLVGDFTNWQENAIHLKKDSGGVWSVTVELTPGAHHYRFMMDGQWCDDPACTQRVPNPYG